jgi:hypothetical protein
VAWACACACSLNINKKNKILHIKRVSSAVGQPGPCVLVLVVYIKIKKNKLLQNCNTPDASVMKCVAVHRVRCVFLRESVMKCVAVLPGPCVFLLVS